MGHIAIINGSGWTVELDDNGKFGRRIIATG